MRALELTSSGVASILKQSNSSTTISALTERLYHIKMRPQGYRKKYRSSAPNPIASSKSDDPAISVTLPFDDHERKDQHLPQATAGDTLYWESYGNEIVDISLLARCTTSGNIRIETWTDATHEPCESLHLLHHEYLATFDVTAIESLGEIYGQELELSLSVLDMVLLVEVDRLLKKNQFTGDEVEACRELEYYLTLHYSKRYQPAHLFDSISTRLTES